MQTKLIIFLILNFSFLLSAAYGGSATWNLNPTSSDWNTAANWNPATVPNGASDIATFGASNTTSVSLSANVAVNEIVFAATAGPFTITTPASSHFLTISGNGITNSSGQSQNVTVPPASTLKFENTATVGPQVTVTNQSSVTTGSPGLTKFLNSSDAGNGTFVTNGAASISDSSGEITFDDTTSAANAS